MIFKLPGWCVIEWKGENAYDAIPKRDVSSLAGDKRPCKFTAGEKVIALYCGKPFKGTVAVTAGLSFTVANTNLQYM